MTRSANDRHQIHFHYATEKYPHDLEALSKPHARTALVFTIRALDCAGLSQHGIRGRCAAQQKGLLRGPESIASSGRPSAVQAAKNGGRRRLRQGARTAGDVPIRTLEAL